MGPHVVLGAAPMAILYLCCISCSGCFRPSFSGKRLHEYSGGGMGGIDHSGGISSSVFMHRLHMITTSSSSGPWGNLACRDGRQNIGCHEPMFYMHVVWVRKRSVLAAIADKDALNWSCTMQHMCMQLQSMLPSPPTLGCKTIVWFLAHYMSILGNFDSHGWVIHRGHLLESTSAVLFTTMTSLDHSSMQLLWGLQGYFQY